MERSPRPLPPRPIRDKGENDCGFALRLLAWYDQAVARGHQLADLPPLTAAERAAILASRAPVLCIAINLGLVPSSMDVRKPPSPAKGIGNPNGTDAPGLSAGSPAAAPQDTVRRGQRRPGRGRKGKTP